MSCSHEPLITSSKVPLHVLKTPLSSPPAQPNTIADGFFINVQRSEKMCLHMTEIVSVVFDVCAVALGGDGGAAGMQRHIAKAAAPRTKCIHIRVRMSDGSVTTRGAKNPIAAPFHKHRNTHVNLSSLNKTHFVHRQNRE